MEHKSATCSLSEVRKLRSRGGVIFPGHTASLCPCARFTTFAVKSLYRSHPAAGADGQRWYCAFTPHLQRNAPLETPKQPTLLRTFRMTKWSPGLYTGSLWAHLPPGPPGAHSHLLTARLISCAEPQTPGRWSFKFRFSTFQFPGKRRKGKRKYVREALSQVIQSLPFCIPENPLWGSSNVTPLSCLLCCGPAIHREWSFPDSLLTNSYSSLKARFKWPFLSEAFPAPASHPCPSAMGCLIHWTPPSPLPQAFAPISVLTAVTPTKSWGSRGSWLFIVNLHGLKQYFIHSAYSVATGKWYKTSSRGKRQRETHKTPTLNLHTQKRNLGK